MILINEVLHTTRNSTFYKTYDPAKDLYGVHTNTAGTFLEPVYLHVFKFTEGKFITVDQLEQYYAVDLKGEWHELSIEEEKSWRSLIIKNSKCNCLRTRTSSTCRVCSGDGQIKNTYGFKLLSTFF